MFTIKHKIQISKRFSRAIHALAKALAGNQHQPQGVEIMITVKDTNPDVQYALSIGDVTDAEGNAITDPAVKASLVTAVESSDSAVVAVTPNPDNLSGNVSFGAPGVATVTATVSLPDGTLLGSGAVSVTVTTGDPAAISNVALKLGDLEDV